MSTHSEPSDAAVRELLERLYVRQIEFRGDVQLLTAELPADWDIALPPGSTVVGTEVRMGFHTRVVLDIPGSPEAAVNSIAQPLLGSGWREAERPRMREGGLMAGAMRGPKAGVMLCDDQRRRHVDITASDGANGMADVRVTLNSDPTQHYACERGQRVPRSPTSIFPPLSPPPSMVAHGGGGGGGGGSVYNNATLSGILQPREIEEHYRRQLTASDWALVDSGSTGQWAWSVWDFTGEHGVPWTAILTVVQPHGLDQFREVTLLASAAPGSAGLGGSSASMRLG